MIVSHKYEFVFIKTKKTAGASVEIALSKFCGVEDREYITKKCSREIDLLGYTFGRR